MKDASFFSFILGTTQDASKIEQLSPVFRFVNTIYNNKGQPVDLQINEVFTSFTAVKYESASGFEKLVIESIEKKGLDINKYLGQTYDSAAIMSDAFTGLR